MKPYVGFICHNNIHRDTVGTEQIHESGANIDLVGTETVLETESQLVIPNQDIFFLLFIVMVSEPKFSRLFSF